MGHRWLSYISFSLSFIILTFFISQLCVEAAVTTGIGKQSNGVLPEGLSDKQFKELHTYHDFGFSTKDKFPPPIDAQKTPQSNDFKLDLGANFDKELEKKLTSGKNFNPLAGMGVESGNEKSLNDDANDEKPQTKEATTTDSVPPPIDAQMTPQENDLKADLGATFDKKLGVNVSEDVANDKKQQTIEARKLLRSYHDFDAATTDSVPPPIDAQMTPQENDLKADLGATSDKKLGVNVSEDLPTVELKQTKDAKTSNADGVSTDDKTGSNLNRQVKPSTLHLYKDLDLATTDAVSPPADAQKTPQENDFKADLGATFDKKLVDELTKGKEFNPLAGEGEFRGGILL